MKVLHIPVLLQEVIQMLDPKPGQNYIDATLGYGGHAISILEKSGPDGELIGIDQDESALSYAKERMKPFGARFRSVHSNFSNLEEVSTGFKVNGGILADIGVSSVQLDNPERGFSFKVDGPLDMRMDKMTELTAAEIVNTWEETKIVKIIREYGEERFASRIANKIVEARNTKHFETTKELESLIMKAIPRKFWPKDINPATKTFQALRIVVNDELSALKTFLPQATSLLKPGARLAVITFHSLEDRIVKDYFRERANPCTCPSEFPKCVCDKVADIRILTNRPIVASDREKEINPRSRSAKLRVIEKL